LNPSLKKRKEKSQPKNPTNPKINPRKEKNHDKKTKCLPI